MAEYVYNEKPIFTAMIQKRTYDEVIELMDKSAADGADAYGIQFCVLKEEFKTPEGIKKILKHAGDKPTYVTNYRHAENEGKSDEALASELLQLAQCGASLVDVMGDLFCKHPEEITDNEEAIKKQMSLIDEIHKAGAKVIMSSHVLKYIPAERVLEIALEQQRRGADVVKIVTGADDDFQQAENMKMIPMLKKELDVPFLYLCGGSCEILRRVGPMLGCCMWLCVSEHHDCSTKTQPILKNAKAIYSNFCV